MRAILNLQKLHSNINSFKINLCHYKSNAHLIYHRFKVPKAKNYLFTKTKKIKKILQGLKPKCLIFIGIIYIFKPLINKNDVCPEKWDHDGITKG